MDSIGEENGNSSNNIDDGHNLSATSTQPQHQSHNSSNSNAGNSLATAPPTASVGTVLTTTANVQYPLAPVHSIQQMHSVIHAANQSSVIQTAATNVASTCQGSKGVLYVNKAPASTTVIHTTSGSAVQLPPNFQCKIKPEPNTQHLDTSEDSLTDDDSPQRRIELTRRPSYHKIFTEISGPDISDNSSIPEDQTRKREIRLQKNREAARECRRKKKEYIKCLENRVAVLENQNKALIEELKSLKELYCQTKIE
ncbi:cyclic AMP response element-binding protein B isoform X3 [Eurosta solidaginis]|uniref:cyclic AMP response element-binding protein B isoform X3 n=1 Tax=Eurosta solidaginis TaxID=178769 RepID=UPI0035308D47